MSKPRSRTGSGASQPRRRPRASDPHAGAVRAARPRPRPRQNAQRPVQGLRKPTGPSRRPVRPPRFGRFGQSRRLVPRLFARLRSFGDSRPLLIVLLVAVLLAAAGVGYLGYELRRAYETADARAQARAAASKYAPAILSYDHRRLGKDFAAAKKHLTDGFAKEYTKTTGKVVRKQAEKYDAVVKAKVVATSVISAKPGQAKTLLFVNQTTKSSRLKSPKVDRNRVLMTLTETDGRWLVSEVDAL